MTPLHIFARKKREGIPLAMVALSDAPSARIACDAGIDAILVGDSLGNTALGYDSTIPVTVDDMAHHLGAVVRGVKSSSNPNVPIIADLPFGSYASPEKGVENAVRLMQLGAHAVKIEGIQDYGSTSFHDIFSRFEATGIPVMGHLGFTPQSLLKFSGIVQGRTAPEAQQILLDAMRLVDAGCFAIVLEAMTEEVAIAITDEISVPTVGIGAGVGCSGQVLVWHDLIGLTEKSFKFARAYAATRDIWTEAVREFKGEVEARSFPTHDNGWAMKDDETENWAKLRSPIPDFGTDATLSGIEPLDEQPF